MANLLTWIILLMIVCGTSFIIYSIVDVATMPPSDEYCHKVSGNFFFPVEQYAKMGFCEFNGTMWNLNRTLLREKLANTR